MFADFGLVFLPMLVIPSMLGRLFLRFIKEAAGLLPFTYTQKRLEINREMSDIIISTNETTFPPSLDAKGIMNRFISQCLF